MVSIFNNINNKYTLSNNGVNQQNIQQTLDKSKDVVSSNVEDNSAVKVLGGIVGSPDSINDIAKIAVPTYLFDKFVLDRAAQGLNGKSVLDKAAKIGDRISHTLKLDNVVSENNVSKISKFLNKNTFTKYFSNDYKAIGKSSMVRTESLADSAFSEFIRKIFPENFGEEAIKQVLEQEGVSEATKKLFSAPEFKTDAAKAAAKLSVKEMTAVGEDVSKVFGDKFSGAFNKYRAASGNIGETVIGKSFAKGALKSKDLFMYGGGILGCVFVASSLSKVIKETKEAPKGEKLSTFAHVLSESYIGIALFQPCISLMYKLGGNKYRGMSVESRKFLQELITKTNADEKLTKEAFKVAKLQKDLLLKGVSKEKVLELTGKTLSEAKQLAKNLKGEGAKLKFWEKPLKAMGKVFNIGLDTMKHNSGISSKIKNEKISKIVEYIRKKTPSGFIGGALRFVMIMFVLQPILEKPITKLVHKIFGEPKTYLNKQNSKEDKNKSNVENNNKQDVVENKVVNPSSTNLLEKYGIDKNAPASNTSKPVDTNSQQAPVTDSSNGEEPVAALNIFKKGKNKDYKGYIPSIEVNYQDNSLKEDEQIIKEVLKEIDPKIKNYEKKGKYC